MSVSGSGTISRGSEPCIITMETNMKATGNRINAMEKEGHQEHEAQVFRASFEMRERVIIAHYHGADIVTRDGKQAAHDSRALPMIEVANEVAYVLNGSKAHSDSDCVNDAVHVLIEVLALADEEPKEE